MEETKELQTMYKIFRCLIYLSLIVEFFEYAIDPALLDYWGGIVCDIHSRVKRWFIPNRSLGFLCVVRQREIL